jgi:hypothetical protein
MPGFAVLIPAYQPTELSDAPANFDNIAKFDRIVSNEAWLSNKNMRGG